MAIFGGGSKITTSFFVFPCRSTEAYMIFPYLVVIPSAVFQVFAASHIAYYRLKYKKEDNRVYTIQIRPTKNDDPEQCASQTCTTESLQLNTNKHNKILFYTKSICVFLVIFSLMLSYYIIGSTNGINLFMDVFPLFLCNIIFPCIFYACHRNVRLYIKKIFYKV